MTVSRDRQIDLQSTPYYHCISRCVRRAYLCGEDKVAKKSFEHRRQWIVDGLKSLTQVFTIEVCAYAVMSNHYHVVLYVNESAWQSLTDVDVIERWGSLFKGSVAARLKDKPQDEWTALEKRLLKKELPTWRRNLKSISWLMRCINEKVAREANREDDCTGRFWEGRFKSQALLDEGALLTCMAYVDLNPIRADLADRPETSDYTSIYERIHQFNAEKRAYTTPSKSKQTPNKKNNTKQLGDKSSNRDKKVVLFPLTQPKNSSNTTTPQGLKPFEKIQGRSIPLFADTTLPTTLKNYLELLELTGRAIREDKPAGHIPEHLLPIFDRLNLEQDHWFDSIKHFRQNFFKFVGEKHLIDTAHEITETRWCKGKTAALHLYRRLDG